MDTFVPLILAGGKSKEDAGSGFRLKIVTQPAGEAVCRAPSSASKVETPAGSHALSEPVLSVQREGDRITGIRIECGCGQVIELACLY
jgi:hypothetical protein